MPKVADWAAPQAGEQAAARAALPEDHQLSQRLGKASAGEAAVKEAADRDARSQPPLLRRIVWHNVILLAALHAVFVWIIISLDGIPWKHALLVLGTGGCYGIGVTAGAHRLWSHKAFKARAPLRVLLALCYSGAGMNRIVSWVQDHRVHHKFTETDADPHNVKRGFFFAHMGWLMQRKHPDVLRQGRLVDMSDVLSDPVVQWHERYFWLLQVLMCYVLPVALPVLLFGMDPVLCLEAALVRHVVLLHAVWSVNSSAHMHGSRPYDRRLHPSENKVVAVLAMGEGWHNYHHVFPWDYKTSEHSYFLNVTTFWIDVFAALGLAHDLRTATPGMVQRVAARHGDGSHHSAHLAHAPQIQDAPMDDYLRVVKEDDAYTGVAKLQERDATPRVA